MLTDWQDGKRVTSGVAGSTISSVGDNVNYRMIEMAAAPGDVFSGINMAQGGTIKAFVFVNSDGIVLDRSPGGEGTVFTGTITAPAGTKKVYICDNKSVSGSNAYAYKGAVPVLKSGGSGGEKIGRSRER